MLMVNSLSLSLSLSVCVCVCVCVCMYVYVCIRMNSADIGQKKTADFLELELKMAVCGTEHWPCARAGSTPYRHNELNI